jgi:PAS domain S-box-containing protein
MQKLNPTIKILVIDDDEDDFFIMTEYLQGITGPNFEIDWCPEYKKALKLICRGAYQIYFVDYLLGVKTGLDLLKEAIKNQCEEPIILLTGKGNQEIDIEAMQAGAIDYLVKSELNVEKLERSIRYALDRTASMKALKLNERKFRNIFEKSRDAVFLADENLVFKEVNGAVSELFDYTKVQLLEFSLLDFVANNADKVELKNYFSAKGEIDDKEVEFLTSGGERKICILSLSGESNNSEQNYVQGIIHDITNLKKAERATLQAEKLGATGRLVQTLAHEVRNPLNNINLSVEGLNPAVKDEEGKTYLDIISRNSHRINDLISELLNSSRPAEIILERTILQDVINQSLSDATDRIKLKRIRLKRSFPHEPAYILSDAQKLGIAFLNIIINAIEAMPTESGLLIVSIQNEALHYKVSIQDNGTGITDENISRLFEPYFTSKKEGLGLGLAATLNILQSHKASIEVQSKLGQGTSFQLTFAKA